MSWLRLTAIGAAVSVVGFVSALLFDHGSPKQTARATTVTRTQTVVKTVSVPVDQGGTSPPTSPPAPTGSGPDPIWRGVLRLNQTGYNFNTVDGPEADDDGAFADVHLNERGAIDFEDQMTAAQWPQSSTPSLAECRNQINAQSLSESEADAITVKTGLALCFSEGGDNSTIVGYLRVKANFTKEVVMASGLVWDDPQ